MACYLDTVWCDGCGVEILWSPVIMRTHDYCCENCLTGLPCECGARQDGDDDRRDRAADAVLSLGSGG